MNSCLGVTPPRQRNGTGPEGPNRTVTPVLGMPNQVFMEEAPPGPKRQRLAFEPRPSYFDEHFLFANTAF